MKKTIISTLLLFCLPFLHAQNYMEFYDLKECPYTPVKIEGRGWLEPEYLKNEEFDACYIFGFENLHDMEIMRYYPRRNFTGNKTAYGKIQLCNQTFYFSGSDILLHGETFYLINYNGKSFFVLIGDMSGYNINKYFIFDITDKKKIRFYELENEFYNDKIDSRTFAIFQNRLCFFAAKRVHNWNGEYFICPYIIQDDELKELTGEGGTNFRVYFLYITKPHFEFKIITPLKK